MSSLSLKQKRLIFLISISVLLLVAFVASIFIGSSHISFVEGIKGLFGESTKANNTIVQKIRLPRIIAAVLIGAALSMSGLIIQTVSNNVMASPTTLGVSNSAVLGANVAIITMGGGVIAVNGGNLITESPYFVSAMAFIFAFVSTLLVLFLSRFSRFNPATTVLIGITFGMFATGVTTLIQYFATDTSLSTAIYWSFGDLGRASYTDDLIILVVVVISLVFFMVFAYRYNALLLGSDNASMLGINLNLFRFISLLLASLLTAVSVSMVGIIGFIGLVIPQICRKIVGNDHKILIPASMLLGSTSLVICDMISKIALNGYTLPVGAITPIIGAPIFVVLLLLSRRKKHD